MATDSHVFSTGMLKVGAPGAAALDNTTLIGEVQDVTFDVAYTRKEVMAAAQVSVFAVDNADHEGKCTLKIGATDINRSLLPYLTGAVHSVNAAGGGNPTQDVYTIGKTFNPQYCRVEFAGVDTNGKNQLIVIQQAKAPGLSDAFKVSDFAQRSMDFSGYPDANGNICTVTLDQ